MRSHINKRIQAPEIERRVGLQPAPLQSDTYVRPQPPKNVENLAQYLGHFSSSLLAAYQSRKQNDQYPSRWTGMTVDQIRAEVDKGGHEFTNDASQAYLGQRVFNEFRQTVDADWELNKDKYEGNYDLFARSHFKQLAENNGLSPVGLHMASQLFERHYPALHKKNEEKKVAQQMYERYENLPSLYALTEDNARSEGKDPPQIAAALWAAHDQAVTDMKLDSIEAEKYALQKAKMLAESGDVELLDAFLKDTRNGKGSFQSKASYTEQATALREQASEAKRKIDFEADWVRWGELQAKIHNGTATDEEIANAPYTAPQKAQGIAQLRNIKDKREAAQKAKDYIERSKYDYALRAAHAASTGQYHTVKSEQIIHPLTDAPISLKPEDVPEIFENGLQQAVQSKRMSEAQAEAYRLSYYAGSGLKNEQWGRTLNGGASAMSIIGTTIDKAGPTPNEKIVPETTTKGFTLYKKLLADAPGTIPRQGLSKDAEDLYTIANNLQQLHGMSDNDALLHAREGLIKQQKGFVNNQITEDDSTLLDKMKSARSGWLPWKSAEGNVGVFLPEVKKQIQTYMLSGIPEEEAIKRAINWLDENHIGVNGDLVRISPGMPKNAGTLMEGVLDIFAEKYGEAEGIISGSDLTVVKGTEPNIWLIFNKRTGLPVASGNETERGFDMRTLQEYSLERAKEIAYYRSLSPEQREAEYKPRMLTSGLPIWPNPEDAPKARIKREERNK